MGLYPPRGRYSTVPACGPFPSPRRLWYPSRAMLSHEFAVLLRPARAYSALAKERSLDTDSEARSRLAWGVALWAVVLGGFVSLTSAGRLTLGHMALAPLGWAFLPLFQAIALAVALRASRCPVGFTRAFGLYLVGHGGWYLLLLSLAGVCLFAPDVTAVFETLLATRALPGLVVLTLAWGMRCTAALFRHGLAVSPRDTARATGCFYLVLGGSIVGWYIALGQLLPLLGVMP